MKTPANMAVSRPEYPPGNPASGYANPNRTMKNPSRTPKLFTTISKYLMHFNLWTAPLAPFDPPVPPTFITFQLLPSSSLQLIRGPEKTQFLCFYLFAHSGRHAIFQQKAWLMFMQRWAVLNTNSGREEQAIDEWSSSSCFKYNFFPQKLFSWWSSADIILQKPTASPPQTRLSLSVSSKPLGSCFGSEGENTECNLLHRCDTHHVKRGVCETADIRIVMDDALDPRLETSESIKYSESRDKKERSSESCVCVTR